MKTQVVYATFIISILIIAIAPTGVLGVRPTEHPGNKAEKPQNIHSTSNNGKAIGKNKNSPGIDPPSTPAPDGTPPPDDPIPPPPEPLIEINLYTDLECTKPLTSVHWGRITAGTTSSTTIYLKNEGDVTIVAHLVTGDWMPTSSSNHMNLNWNYDGDPVEPGESVRIILQLTVDPDCPTYDSFNFNITIIGS